MTKDEIEFNSELAYQQIIEKRKQELLTEQTRPQLQYNPYQHQQQQSKGPKFDPYLDTKMTFDRNGEALTINGKAVEEIENARTAQIAAKLGMETDANSIFQARRYHKEVLQYHKQGVPAHLQMYGINEWAPSKEVKKYAKMVDLGDEAGAAFQTQTRQLNEHIARKYPAENTDLVINQLSGQTKQVASSMVENLALGKAKFLHNQPQGQRQLLTENQPTMQPHINPGLQPGQQSARPMIAEGAVVYKILDTSGMPIPCRLARPIVQYNSAQHGMLTPTGKVVKTFIVQNEQARIDIGVIQSNPQFIKETVEVVDSRGGVFVVEQQSLTRPLQQSNFPSPQSSKFLNDQYRPTTNQNQSVFPKFNTNNKFLKG